MFSPNEKLVVYDRDYCWKDSFDPFEYGEDVDFNKTLFIQFHELSFYKKMNLPLPHLCPNCRHYQRLKQRNPLKLWHRQCMCDKTNHDHEDKCVTEFETSYTPNKPEIIYCEKCYQQEVY